MHFLIQDCLADSLMEDRTCQLANSCTVHQIHHLVWKRTFHYPGNQTPHLPPLVPVPNHIASIPTAQTSNVITVLYCILKKKVKGR